MTAAPHVWLVSTRAAGQSDWFAHHVGAMTPSEKARLERITRQERRLQFVAAHVALRRLVAARTGEQVDAVDVDVLACGRPQARLAANAAGGAAGWVSASHSGMHVAVMHADSPVGIDIECWRPRLPIGTLERWCRDEAAFKTGNASSTIWSASTDAFILAAASLTAAPRVWQVDMSDGSSQPEAIELDWRELPLRTVAS